MTARVVAFERWKDGEITTSTYKNPRQLERHLVDGEDDGRTFYIISVIIEGPADKTFDLTPYMKSRLCTLARRIDEIDGVPPDERPWIHPLAFAGGFEWTQTDAEALQAEADR